MTLVQLRHFLTLAETATFMQASRVLFLTQPALSRSIRALEDELGGALFDRLGRQVALTPFGEEVLRRARRLVSDAEALKQVGRGLHAGLTGQLRIGLSSAPGALFSTPLLRHMAAHHPGLHLQVSRGSTSVLLSELREQRLDGAIVDLRSMVPAADLKVTQAFDLEAGFLVRSEHPLAGRGGSVSFPELLAYPVASTPLSDEVGRTLVARYGPQANPQDLVTLRCDETLTLVELARTADVVLLTVTAVAADLVRLEVSPPLDATGRFGLVTLGGREEAPAMRIVADILDQWVLELA